MKQIVLGINFMCALNDSGGYICGYLFKKKDLNELEKPEEYKERIKYMSEMKSLCAVKDSGELGCWNPDSLVFEDIILK